MITFKKTSEVSKVVVKNERESKFQDGILRMQAMIKNKKKTILSRVTSHESRLNRIGKWVSELSKANIKPVADYTACYEDFIENVSGINGKLLADLIDDKLQKDLDKCTTKEQESIVNTYHRINAESTLQRVELMTSFYTAIGLHKVEKAPAKKSGTRTRKATKKTVKA